MRAFLEKTYFSATKSEWFDDFVYVSNNVLYQMGIEVIPFDESNLSTIDKHIPTKEDIIIGSVEATVYFFNLIRVKTPQYLGYPESLKKYLGREIKQIRADQIDHFPVFIKPATRVKQFTGAVVENEDDLHFMKTYCNLTEDTEIFQSECLNFVSEYRCFVYDKELVGIKHYKGDYTQFINPEIVKQAIRDYKDAPIAYTLDFGVVPREGGKDPNTELVEVNDFWAIGYYGLDPRIYVKLCIRRMRQITSTLATIKLDLEDYCEILKGKPTEIVICLINQQDIDFRIVKEDDKQIAITMDMSFDRLELSIENGIVTNISVG